MRRAIGLLAATILTHGTVLRAWTPCEREAAADTSHAAPSDVNEHAGHAGHGAGGHQSPAPNDDGDSDATSETCALMAACGSAVVVSAGIVAPLAQVEASIVSATGPSPRSFVVTPEPPPPRV